jgi:hypothetical protein
MLWMIKGTSIKTHLDEFNSIIMNFKSINIMIEHEDKAFYIITFLTSLL